MIYQFLKRIWYFYMESYIDYSMITYRYRFVFLSVFLLFLLPACLDEDGTETIFPGKTVLVYMVADNSLSSDSGANIDSMAAGLRENDITGNLLIYVDRSDETPELIQLVKSDDGSIRRETIRTYPEQNSVSVAVMSSVLKEVARRFPSESYGLVLWSHGYGWLPATTTSSVSTRWFGLDGSDEMDLPDLVTALNEGPPFDYILFDACFMGGVETAYALRNCAGYLIVSPTEVLSDGFPYSKILPYMFGSMKSDYIRIASLYYEHYHALTGYDCSAAVSCIKCSGLEALASETKSLIDTHAADLDSFDVSSVQSLEGYSPHLFYDFGHFVETFTTGLERYSFEQQLKKTVVYEACTENILSVSNKTCFFPVTHFSGLNTYIPSDENATRNASYRDLEWYSAAGWNHTRW